MSSVITSENAEKWLNNAKFLSQRNLEREIAKVNPKLSVHEGSHFVSETTLEFRAAVSIDTEQMMKRVQDLLSQSHGRAVSYDETLNAMGKLFLERKDPVEKATRVMTRALKKSKACQNVEVPKMDALEATSFDGKTPNPILDPSTPNTTRDVKTLDAAPVANRPLAYFKNSSQRRALPQKLKHQVFMRDQGYCQARENDGSLCNDKRWLHLHHKVPVSLGGQNTMANIVTLCQSHHRFEHHKN